MTRTKLWETKRMLIAQENSYLKMNYYPTWFSIYTHQSEIKKEGGFKH